MVKKWIERLAARGLGLVERLVAASLRGREKHKAKPEGKAMAELKIRKSGIVLWAEACDP